MPKFDSRTRNLPPARLGPAEFKAIEQALGPDFASSARWNFWSGHTNISAENLDQLLDEASDVRGISDFEFDAQLPEASITLSAGGDGCVLEYEASHTLLAQTQARARDIEGLFRENKRRGAIIPRPFASLPLAKKVWLSPSIKVGPPSRLRLDWNSIIQTAITNWLSHAGTAVISFALGAAFGWLVRAIL
jgi:hypothetical protein